MKDPFFTMKPQMHGFIKYILLAVVPSAAVGFLLTWDTAAWIFILLAAALILPRSHFIVVFENALIVKSLHGRNRFIRKVYADQIDHYHQNCLGEFILVDAQNKKLLCIESGMSNRDRFEQWLISHHIDSK